MDQHRFAQQRQFNRETRAAWESFASHRRRVSDYLIDHGGKTLAVWGAGNCNDLDLSLLLQHFQQITLFDLDLAAVEAGIERQNLASAHRIDVVQADAIDWGTAPLSRCNATTYDLVASTCLLSQLLIQVHTGEPDSSQRNWAQIESMRLRHLELLLTMTAPNGWTLCFNDFLSSDTCSQLTTCEDSELPDLIQRELAQRNFFTGLNPFALQRVLATNSSLSGLVAETHLAHPWKWNLGNGRYYAVCLHRWRRAG